MTKDSRFNKFNDPKYHKPKNYLKKTKVDPRFNAVFDSKFEDKSAVDKRGKIIVDDGKTSLSKYYQKEKNDKKEKVDRERKDESDSDDEMFSSKKREYSDESGSDVDSDDSDHVDLARGIYGKAGILESSDYDSSDEDEESLMRDEEDLGWGEFDADAPRSENISKRLALCNMNWEKVKAEDIFYVLSSFKSEGNITKVSIYKSEYGKERMKEDGLKGPQEIREIPDDEDSTMNEEEREKFNNEQLRKYQLNKMKYFYAVVECDSAATADCIYGECNDKELELYSTKLDLRFIPDDMDFDEEDLVDSCDKLVENHQLVKPTTTALSQSKTQNTFDLTDPRRLAITTKKFEEDEINEQDFKHLIASSDSDEEYFNDEKNTVPKYAISMTSKQDDIERYGDVWRMAIEEAEKDDPFRHRNLSDSDEFSTESESESGSDSDNIVTQPKKGILKKKKAKQQSEDEEDGEEAKRRKAELELVMMEEDQDEDESKHFDMKQIIKNQELKKKGNKRKNRKKLKENKEGKEFVDDFKLDLEDSRFSEVFTSSKFAPDPNHPSYKNTESMQELMKKKISMRKKSKKQVNRMESIEEEKGLLQKLMAKEIPEGKNVKKVEKSEENSVKKMQKIVADDQAKEEKTSDETTKDNEKVELKRKVPEEKLADDGIMFRKKKKKAKKLA